MLRKNKKQKEELPSNYQLQNNILQFKNISKGFDDGVRLKDEEKEYLLPHFLMLLIGKPASGKTTLLRQLLTNDQMYHKKFDHVFLVSPSYAKMDLEVKHGNATAQFSLDWIFSKIQDINEKQKEKVYGHKFGGQKLVEDKKTKEGKTLTNVSLMSDNKSRFQVGQTLKKLGLTNMASVYPTGHGMLGYQNNDTSLKYFDSADLQYQLEQQQQYKDVEQLSQYERERTFSNILIVLDDVVASIKKAEFDPRLAKLVMNRRHLILNATISIIIVSQKYTLIPARIRSNASWLILYQLNPKDFELVYSDAVIHDYQTWQSLLRFVFGTNYRSSGTNETEIKKVNDLIKDKKFENIGIWVEFNLYFKNFKRIQLELPPQDQIQYSEEQYQQQQELEQNQN